MIAPAGAAPIRVLLVDDSAVVRGVFGRIVDAQPDMKVVTTAPNGRMALAALGHVPVDVVVLDVEMPEMDGLSALTEIVARFPAVRVLMASTLTARGAEVTMKALALGAADFVQKPLAAKGATALGDLERDLVGKIRGLARGASSVRPIATAPRPAASAMPAATAARQTPRGSKVFAPRPEEIIPTSVLGKAGDPPRLLAVAASTGGPNALAAFLGGLPKDFPLPTLIVQHMPPLFTSLLAQRLARDTNRPCVEAVDGLRIEGGTTYVAPGDHHMLVATADGVPYIRLTSDPPENFCRPAADPMFRTAAAAFGPTLVAVVLTGMGEDGCAGIADVVRRGGHVAVQDESTSVVWGMPGAVANAGLAHAVLPLPDLARHVAGHCLAAR